MQSLNSSIIYFPVVLITFQIIWRKFALRCRKNEKGPIDFLMDFSHSFLSQKIIVGLTMMVSTTTILAHCLVINQGIHFVIQTMEIFMLSSFFHGAFGRTNSHQDKKHRTKA